MPFQLPLCAMSILAVMSLCYSVRADEPEAVQRVAIKSLDEIPWMLGTSQGETTLGEDVEGIGSKGDKIPLQVTTEKIQGGKYLMATGFLLHEGQRHEVFREIWGSRPSDPGLYKWVFDRSGMALEGKLYFEGKDKIVHVIEGEMLPNEKPFKPIAEKLGLEKLPYYGEMVFRHIDEETLGVMVRTVKIGGLPFPWPNLGNEEIFRDVEQD